MITANLQDAIKRYKNTQVIEFIDIAAGQTQSGVINCGGIPLRSLIFPSNWTAGNVSFYTSLGQEVDLSYVFSLKTNFDGSPLLIATIANQDLPMVPAYFDSTTFFKINCSVAQATAARIKATFQPIWQGIHA